jgi:ABC-type dipeptide transport system, periplasmic component
MTARRALTSILLAVLAVGVWTAGVAAQPAGTLLVGLVAEPVNLDPAQVTDLNSNRVGRRIVEALVAFPDESTQVIPGLAESWTISKDGLQYTFKLRSGVKFHDGTPLNAEAVKFSIERQINTEHPAYKLGKYPFANYNFGNVKAVEVLSDERVAFLLKEPRASFLAIMTSGAAVHREPHRRDEVGSRLSEPSRGHRPFRFASWDRGQRVVLEKNPTYWKYPVKLERVIYRPIVEDQARLTELLTGGLDLIVGVPADFVGQLEQNPKVSVLKQTGRMSGTSGSTTRRSPSTTSACARP